MKFVVLLNPRAGALEDRSPDEQIELVRRAFVEAGAQAEVKLIDDRSLEPAARDAAASDADAVIAAGGDGTINSVVNAIAHHNKPFGVLPLGTHNHFAKDLGMPMNLDQAAAALVRGTPLEIPTAEVNGRIFLNFSAIGFHPELVRHRDGHTLRRAFARFRRTGIKLTARGHHIGQDISGVLLCNNPHQMKAFGVKPGPVPDRGLLNVYITAPRQRVGMIRLFLRALLGHIEEDPKFHPMALMDVRIDTGQRTTRVSIDGEVLDMRPPLRYRVRPQGLRVIVPPAEESSAGAETPAVA